MAEPGLIPRLPYSKAPSLNQCVTQMTTFLYVSPNMVNVPLFPVLSESVTPLGRGWGYFFYFDFGLFYKVTGLIFTQVKAHKGS